MTLFEIHKKLNDHKSRLESDSCVSPPGICLI